MAISLSEFLEKKSFNGFWLKTFFQNTLIFVVDKISHSQGMTPFQAFQKYGVYNYYYLILP